MQELSKEAGITLSLYSAIESMRCFPPDGLRERISSILNEKADYLFPERFRAYCSEEYRKIYRVSEDVLDKLNRVKFNAKAFRKTPDSEDYREPVETEDRDEYIRNLLNNTNLPEKKRGIFNSRFGFKDGNTHTFEESGAIFHATKARAQQIELEVLEKLKHPTRLRKLKELL